MERLKYALIRTPLEEPLRRVRRALGFVERRRHPELREIHREEERIDLVLERVLRPTSSCIDVGCHYGSMLSVFCRRAPAGRHLAFEPIPEKVRFLRKKFPEVDVRELALSDHAGSETFFVDEDASGFSGLARTEGHAYAPITVACARLDDVAPRDRRFDLLKVDVEGAELFVLRGATELLLRDRPLVLFECGPGGPVSYGYSPTDLYDLFTKGGAYSVFLLRDFLEGRRPIARDVFLRAVTVYPFQGFNWIAAPDGHVASC